MITIRVTEQDGPIEGRFRDIAFSDTEREEAMRFKADAEDDGTYWGMCQVAGDETKEE